MKSFAFGSHMNEGVDESRYLVISPDKQFLYMPPSDFGTFRTEILATYSPDLTCDDNSLVH
jgi:hypothetical protein